METLDIIKNLESILPNSFAEATIVSSGKRIPLFDYLENDFVKFVKPGATPQILAQFINERLSGIIKLNDVRMQTLNSFINNNPFFKEMIQIGPGDADVIFTRSYLTDYVMQYMDDDGNIDYVGRNISIEELYLKLLNNEYHAPTLEDKAELCINMASFIDKEILDSIVDGMDITVFDYLTHVLPTKMDTISTVAINGVSEDIDEFIRKIVDHQVKLIAEVKEKAKKQKEDEYNKTGDNPGLVSEIQVRLNEDNGLQITAEIPVVTSSIPTQEEEQSLLANYLKKASVTSDEYYRGVLNCIKDAIESTNNLHDLESKSNYFEKIVSDIKAEANGEELYSNLGSYITSVEELIAEVQKNLIKINGNLEEYTDVLFSEINSMNDELAGFTTLDEYSSLYGKALLRYEDALNKGIKDIQLRSAFHLLFNRINEKRLNLDATIGYQSPEVERVKIELNELISSIKQDVLTIEHDSNNLGNLAGTQVRLNLNIERANARVDEAYAANLLTETDREYYRNRLKGYSMALESEAKIGFGIR